MSRFLAAAASVAIAAGLLTASPPVQALPMPPLAPAPCSQFVFPDGDWPVHIEGGGFILQTRRGTNPAGRVVSNNGQNTLGNVTFGGIYGGRNIGFTIVFNGGVTGRYTGTVSDDGLVHDGGMPYETGSVPGAKWTSTRPLECDTPAPQPAPAPAPQPAPPEPVVARLAVSVNGPATLQAGMSGTYNVIVSNPGIAGAPVELLISFNGNLQQTGQLRVPDGFDCSEGAGSVRCTTPQVQPKTTSTVTVQGRGPTAGPGQLTVNINSSDPAAQFVQKSQQLNVTIT